MVKIAIVEDERLEREAIKLLLSRMHIETEVVYEAFQGEDAVRLFRLHRPHLVLLDIQIPRLSGLEVAKQIRGMDAEVAIVIISAYDNFQFAQQALQLGALDYLLKPYSQERLYGVVSQVHRRLAAREKKREQDAQHTHLMGSINRYMKQELFTFLVTGRVLDADSDKILTDYFGLKPNRFCLALLRTGPLEEQPFKALCQAMRLDFRAVLCRQLNLDLVVLLPHTGMADLAGAVLAAARRCPHLPQGQPLRCLAGGPVENLQQLAASFQQLCGEMDSEEDNTALRSRQILSLYDLESQLYHHALRRRWRECRACLVRLGEIAHDVNHHQLKPVQSYFGHLWRQVDRVAYQTTGRRRSTQIKLSIDSELERAQNLEQLVDMLMDYLQWYINQLGLDNSLPSKNIIEDIKEYIAANLAKDLSLEKMGEVVGLSPFHLSKQFKKVAGVNYKNYVIATRMEKAKQLLAGGGMMIREVAGAVGYSDAGYFSRAFKEYAGMSAKDFADG